MNSNQIIFTMTEPDDLYIVGFLGSDKAYDNMPKEYSNRLIEITDDYSTIGIKGLRKKTSTNSVETVGSFLLATKTEWDTIFRPIFEPTLDMYEHNDEPYAISVKDYVGDVMIDKISDTHLGAESGNWTSVWTNGFHDPKEGMSYQDCVDGNYYSQEVVLLESGFETRRLFIPSLFGYTKSEKTTYEDIVVCMKCNKEVTGEFVGAFCECEDSIKQQIGEKKTVIIKWIK